MRDDDPTINARQRMVTEQILQRGLSDQRVLDAMQVVPRHLFVTEENQPYAYSDGPLPIGHGQTISQPYIVALMTSLLALKGDERVLDVGTGSGYQAAILARLSREVHTVEFIPELSVLAKNKFTDLSLKNVFCHIGDGSLGWPDSAPYEGILVAAAAPRVPNPLLAQLSDGGRLVIPVGSQGFQELECWTRHGESYSSKKVTPVTFVPLRGKHGWSD